MSYIVQYKSTLEAYLKGKSNRILLVDNNGYKTICNLFSQEEINDMGVIGVLKIEDKDLLRADNVFENEIVFFVGIESYTRITTIINKAITHVYILFYNYVAQEYIDELKRNSKICEVSYGCLQFYPTSERSVVGQDAFTILKHKPRQVLYHKSAETLKEYVGTKLQQSLDKCAIREKEDNTILYVLGRNYDEITPIVTPWRYQSLLNYLDIPLGPPGTDNFFATHKFTLYNEVIDEFSHQSSSLASQKKITTDVTDKFKLDDKTRIVAKHVDLSSTIQKLTIQKKILEKSALEQRALVGTANSAELKELEQVNPQLYHLLMAGKSATLKGIINTLNFFGENSERSTFHQYVPPLREVLRGLKLAHQKCQKIYIYIEGFICYEEIAEVALSNTMGMPLICLMSDSIQKSQLNPALVTNKLERTNEIFRVNKHEFKNQATLQPNMYYSDIETKINYLKKHSSSFNQDEENMCNDIKTSLPVVLTKEFTLLKEAKPRNKLEKNINNIKLSRLSKLATEFSKFDKSDRRTHEMVTSFSLKFDHINENKYESKHYNQSQSLLLMQTDEDEQLREMEEEIDRREQGITDIYEKTIQIHAMCVEVHALVAKQTLMLGTIEENIVNACDLVTEADIQLEQADKYQQNANSLSNKLIAGLFGIVVFLGIGVGIKESIAHGHN